MGKRAASLALVGAALAATTLGASADAQAQAQAGLLCPSNAICLWRGQYHTGARYVWTGGYHDLPAGFTDHVGSFRANRTGAFIDWATGKVCHPVRKGDYGDFYLRGFGGKMDAVGNTC
ncbi:peptidase inhibitor family I36 protein [Streptomyces sp. NPDC004684]